MSNTNRKILLQGSATIEQFDENDNPKTEKTIQISDYPSAVDDALERFNTKEDVLTQLIDNLSDATENCVLSYSIEENALSF